MTASRKSAETDTRLITLRAGLARTIAAHIAADGKDATAIPGLSLYRRSEPSDCMSVHYQPELVVFAQGEKRINLGGITHVCDGSNFLLTSVDLPVVSQVTKASRDKPILGMVLKLQMAAVREILSLDEFPEANGAVAARGMVIGTTPPDMLKACQRLLDLLDTPRDIPFLSTLLQKEILYRLLRGPLGKHLRAIATMGDQSNRTAKAVSWLRENYNKPLRIEELAQLARMGVSTLHHQFRSLTSMSPLQYQKQLRLQVARERMLSAGLDAATAAFEVGYESASQFNREYSRLFGQPPMRDVKARLMMGVQVARD